MGVSPHLLRAYELARQQSAHPNPRVGAVLVSNSGEVIGEGSHRGPGRAHAEIEALDAADPRGATLYVSLEPCGHHGRTPPCVDRIIADGVERVVVGTIDPDPKVSGSGVARLREAGIAVDVIDDPEAREVDAGYFHHRQTGLPLVTLKYAMTLDGSVAAADLSSRWITSAEARADAHYLRAENDGIVVGAGTIVADDPRLDVRVEGYAGPQPRPVIIAGDSELPAAARIWDRAPLVVSAFRRAIPAGELALVEGDTRPAPGATARALADMGYLSLLLEGGPKLAASWWREKLVTRGVAYVGALVGGGRGMPPIEATFATIGDAEDVAITGVRRIGPDVRVDFVREV